MKPVLYVGNLNYSSWSLRPYLALRWAGIDFDLHEVELDQPGYGGDGIAELLALAPTGKVPILRLGDTCVADSLAISEWAHETGMHPLYPADSLARARVRSVVAEMHSGYAGVRRDLSMNIRRRCTAFGLPDDTQREIQRLDRLFSGLRQEHASAGSHLFGLRTLADAFFTPVATRFRTYGIPLSPDAQSYCDTLLADPAFLEWEARVLAQPARGFSRSNTDQLYA
jgi:glutathione S-transferase